MPRLRANPRTARSFALERSGTEPHKVSWPVLQLLLLANLLSGLVMAGCGPRNPATTKVEGVVALDGQPIEGAAVVFTPSSGPPATGTTDSDGRFVLSTFKQGDGAVLGQHRVTVGKTRTKSTGPDEEEELVFIVPKQYANPSTSPLTCEVQPEMPAVRFELQSAAPSPPLPEAAPPDELSERTQPPGL